MFLRKDILCSNLILHCIQLAPAPLVVLKMDLDHHHLVVSEEGPSTSSHPLRHIFPFLASQLLHGKDLWCRVIALHTVGEDPDDAVIDIAE